MSFSWQTYTDTDLFERFCVLLAAMNKLQTLRVVLHVLEGTREACVRYLMRHLPPKVQQVTVTLIVHEVLPLQNEIVGILDRALYGHDTLDPPPAFAALKQLCFVNPPNMQSMWTPPPGVEFLRFQFNDLATELGAFQWLCIPYPLTSLRHLSIRRQPHAQRSYSVFLLLCAGAITTLRTTLEILQLELLRGDPDPPDTFPAFWRAVAQVSGLAVLELEAPYIALDLPADVHIKARMRLSGSLLLAPADSDCSRCPHLPTPSLPGRFHCPSVSAPWWGVAFLEGRSTQHFVVQAAPSFGIGMWAVCRALGERVPALRTLELQDLGAAAFRRLGSREIRLFKDLDRLRHLTVQVREPVSYRDKWALLAAVKRQGAGARVGVMVCTPSQHT
jgi:hypothetical protein